MLDTPLFSEERAQQAAFAIAQQYLQTAKGWKTEEYSLELLRVEGNVEMPIIIVDCISSTDLHSPLRGGGQSVQLTIDINQQRVVRELAYQ
jgi:hypothetical protein